VRSRRANRVAKALFVGPQHFPLHNRGELTRRAQEIAARHYDIPHSKRTAVSVDTLLDWALRYRNGGFEALAGLVRIKSPVRLFSREVATTASAVASNAPKMGVRYPTVPRTALLAA